MSGSIEGGHFVGFVLAIAGVAAILLATSRPNIARKLGEKRVKIVIVAMLGLALLALYGNGKRVMSFQTAVGPSYGVPLHLKQADVDEALDIVTDARFLEYVADIHSSPHLKHPERLRKALVVRAGTTVDLKAEGYRIEPPPPLGQDWFFVTYYDEQHALFAALDRGEGMEQWKLAQNLVSNVLPHVVTLVKLRKALTSEERASILQEMSMTVPYAAEWIVAELDRESAGATGPIADLIARKQAYARLFIKDPTMRGLPEGTRIDRP